MISVSVGDLTKDVEKYLRDVKDGETIEVQEEGKPVAIVSPPGARAMDRWKRAPALKIEGFSWCREILADREKGR